MNTIERAAKYIAQMLPAISGDRGQNATFKVAVALCHGFGLNEEEAWPILLKYNKRCKPPWTEKELRHKLKDANNLDRHSQPRGYLRAKADFLSSSPAKPAKPAKPIRMRAVSWQERAAEVGVMPETEPTSAPPLSSPQANPPTSLQIESNHFPVPSPKNPISHWVSADQLAEMRLSDDCLAYWQEKFGDDD